MVIKIDNSLNRIRYIMEFLKQHMRSDKVALKHDQLVERQAASKALANVVLSTKTKPPKNLTDDELRVAAKKMLESLNEMRNALFLISRVLNDLKASEEYLKKLPKDISPKEFVAMLELFILEFRKISSELNEYLRFWNDIESNIYAGKNITKKWFASRQHKHFSRTSPRFVINKIFREEMELDKHLIGLMDTTLETFSRTEIAGIEKGLGKKTV